MRTIIAVVAALTAGFILGGIGPRQEVRDARQELEQTRRQLEQSRRHTPLDSFASSVLNRRATRSPEDTMPARIEQPAAVAGHAADPEPAAARPERARARNRPRPSLEESIQTQTELWQARAELRRAQLLEKTGLLADEIAVFDAIIDQMNHELAERVARWTEFIQAHEFINEEMRIRMLSDFSGVVVAGYDQLYQIMPEGWRDDAGSRSEFEIRDYIDPRAFLPMTNIIDHVRPPGIRPR